MLMEHLLPNGRIKRYEGILTAYGAHLRPAGPAPHAVDEAGDYEKEPKDELDRSAPFINNLRSRQRAAAAAYKSLCHIVVIGLTN